MVADVLMVIIQALVYVWSFVTWPFYFLYYQPWKSTRQFHRKRANRIEIQKDEVIYRAAHKPSKIREELVYGQANVNTMDHVWKYAVNKYANKRCLGTRKIIEERKVPGPGQGKMFNKLVMEPTYKWLDYEQVDRKSTYIGR